MKVITIGRSSKNDICIKDGLVSRNVHCQLFRDDEGRYFIMDGKSCNGTFVNGVKIPIGKRFPLTDTDVVKIGDTLLPWQSYWDDGNMFLDYTPLGLMGLFAGFVFFVITWLLEERFRITMVGDLFLGSFCFVKSLRTRKCYGASGLQDKDVEQSIKSLFWLAMIWGCISVILTIIKL